MPTCTGGLNQLRCLGQSSAKSDRCQLLWYQVVKDCWALWSTIHSQQRTRSCWFHPGDAGYSSDTARNVRGSHVEARRSVARVLMRFPGESLGSAAAPVREMNDVCLRSPTLVHHFHHSLTRVLPGFVLALADSLQISSW